jgi:FkbM family methyltransferase
MSLSTPGHSELDKQRLTRLAGLGVNLPHFFDIGASNGVWSRRLSEAFPDSTFDLFEPLFDDAPAYHEKMNKMLAANPRCRLHKVALGSECKRARMFVPDDPVNGTTLELGSAAPRDWRTLQVDMLTIDYAIKEFRVPIPQVIKIDTQGCELEILKGARQTLPQVQALVLECWLKRAYGPATPLLLEIADWLRNFDFYLWDLGENWRDPQGTLGSQDCFFLNARSSASPLHGEPLHHSKTPAARSPTKPAAPGLLKWMRGLLRRRA